MKELIATILSLMLGLVVLAQPMYKTQNEITVGAMRSDQYLDMLKGKRVAIVGNHTSMVGQAHIVDLLMEMGVDMAKVFAPEHGFRGKADAGEQVADGRDSKTGLPIVSLYGSHKKPTTEDLADVDVVIFDIQDVGARFYTYISTMFYVMEACAENEVEFIVFDRPNPNGFYVDGPVLDMEYQSFVGMLPIPVVHGMTVGELAKMINGQRWLADSLVCDLEVIPCLGYTHNDIYVLPEKPSPNLPNMNAILLYPSLCFFEGTVLSVGRGTDHPFEVFGHPNMTQGSYVFVPKANEGSKYPKHEGVPCVGWDLRDFGGKNVQEKQRLILSYLINAYRDYPDRANFFLANGFFDKLAGTNALRLAIQSGKDEAAIRASWEPALSDFKRMRLRYLMYD